MYLYVGGFTVALEYIGLYTLNTKCILFYTKNVSGCMQIYLMIIMHVFPEEMYHLRTPPSDKLGSAALTTQNNHISFKTWGCTPAILGLFDDFDFMHGGPSVFEVAIGLDNDSHVAIFKAKACWAKG